MLKIYMYSLIPCACFSSVLSYSVHFYVMKMDQVPGWNHKKTKTKEQFSYKEVKKQQVDQSIKAQAVCKTTSVSNDVGCLCCGGVSHLCYFFLNTLFCLFRLIDLQPAWQQTTLEMHPHAVCCAKRPLKMFVVKCWTFKRSDWRVE